MDDRSVYFILQLYLYLYLGPRTGQAPATRDSALTQTLIRPATRVHVTTMIATCSSQYPPPVLTTTRGGSVDTLLIAVLTPSV